MAFSSQYYPPNPFTAERVQQPGSNGNYRDPLIDHYESERPNATVILGLLPENLLAQKRKWNIGRLRTRVKGTNQPAKGASLFEWGFAACAMSSIILETRRESTQGH
ncbi:unnamed protein product [Fusarium fujikuroi]|nr:uncharacterized protein FFC1_09138 [Fusarium fujikuroi]VTT64150.1 unnamed protein product [Fusarium fujikuroi]